MVIFSNGNTDRDDDSSHSGRNYWDRHGGLRLGLPGIADNRKNLIRTGLTALSAFVAGHSSPTWLGCRTRDRCRALHLC